MRDDALRIVGRKRLEQERGCVQLAATPRRAKIEELRARDTEQEDRRVARRVDEMVEQVEERWLRPVDVLEHENERALPGEDGEELSHGPEEPGRRARRLGGTDRTCDPVGDLLGVRLTGDEPCDRLARGRTGSVAHDLGERPKGGADAIDEAAADENVRLAADGVHELLREPRLADAGGAE